MMVDQIAEFIMDIFGNLFGVFILSMSPILELRGSVFAGWFAGFEWWQVYPVAVLGNIVPIPFALFFLRKIIGWLKKKGPFKKMALKMEQKAEANADKIRKRMKIGLYFFVAIPLPGTGAWTASLVASVLDMKLKECFWSIALGVVTAGFITTLVTYGAIDRIIALF